MGMMLALAIVGQIDAKSWQDACNGRLAALENRVAVLENKVNGPNIIPYGAKKEAEPKTEYKTVDGDIRNAELAGDVVRFDLLPSYFGAPMRYSFRFKPDAVAVDNIIQYGVSPAAIVNAINTQALTAKLYVGDYDAVAGLHLFGYKPSFSQPQQQPAMQPVYQYQPQPVYQPMRFPMFGGGFGAVCLPGRR